MEDLQFTQYANSLFYKALELLPQGEESSKNIIFEPVYTDEIIAKIQFSNPRKIIYSFGFSMFIYRIVRLALASNPLFYSNLHKHRVIPKEHARLILKEIIKNYLDNNQGGIHYSVSPQVIQMSEELTKGANLFFILHEICHCLIIDDKFNSFMTLLLWGTPTKIPKITDNQIEHEVLADRLASTFIFQNILIERNEEYYENIMRNNPDILNGQSIQKLVKQDLGMKLIGIECALFSQLVLEKYNSQNPNYLDFKNRVNWNRKFLVDLFGFEKDVFYIPEVVIGFLIELFNEIENE